MSAQAAERPIPDSDLVPALARGIDEAGYAVFRAAASETENTAVSPSSIGLAFGMADAGASGQVSLAIEQTFALPGEGDERLAAFNAYEQRLAIAPGTKGEDADGHEVELPMVTIANKVFTDTAFTPSVEYVETVQRWFGADAQSIPLRTDPGAAADTMNDWISDQTNGLIKDLYDADSFSDASRLELLNALYMKAQWRDELTPEHTQDWGFTRLDGSRVEVPMMNATVTASGAMQGDGYVAGALAYAGDALEMVVIVPDEGRFAEVRDRLDPALMEEIDAGWSPSAAFTVLVPRFEAATRVDLRDVMEDTMGIEGLFDTEGLDGIAPDLVIGSAIHATKVIVDEEGTEAAAVTGIGVEAAGAMVPAESIDVVAERPFLYVIRDIDTGASLFVGQVLDPTA
ncbi:serpin family protein [Demequina sp.]|uniref:serpin family protein n=1 Tax=Demequina sp. TaxID=2050685 RepID=UPI003A83CE70